MRRNDRNHRSKIPGYHTAGMTGTTEQDVSVSPSPGESPKDSLDMTETNLPITILLSPISYLLSPISNLQSPVSNLLSPLSYLPCPRPSHHPTNLYTRFHYILILLVAVVIYLIYLIGYYKVQEYGTDAFMESLRIAGQSAESRIEKKEFLASYIRTRAYETEVAKATQNKKLPGEEVINIVTEEEVSSNADIDTRNAIAGIQSVAEDPTRGMSNPQKWWWMIEEGVRRGM